MNTIRTQVHGEPRSKPSRVSWQLYGTHACALILALFTLPAGAQNLTVQCPTSTPWHPTATTSAQGEPTGTAPQLYQPPIALRNGAPLTYVNNGGTGKCQQISGGDGYMTEADGNHTFMFSFGPFSGLDKIKRGKAASDATDFSLSDIGTRDALPGCQSELVKKYFGRHFAHLQVPMEVVRP
jgi:hypothetical protein